MGIRSRQRLSKVIAVMALMGLLVAGPGDLVGATARGAVVTGTIRIFGGVASTSTTGTPASGQVVFKRKNGKATKIQVGKSGSFELVLQAGTYTAFGGPPGWHDTCSVKHGRPFRVASGHHVKVLVACIAA